MKVPLEGPWCSYRNCCFYPSSASHSLPRHIHFYLGFARSLHKHYRSWALVRRSLVGGRLNDYADEFSEVWGLLLFHVFLDVLLTSKNFLAGSQKFALGWVLRTWARVRRSFGPAA